MIEELKIMVNSFEFAGKFVLIDAEKANGGGKIRIKMLRDDLDWIMGKFND